VTSEIISAISGSIGSVAGRQQAALDRQAQDANLARPQLAPGLRSICVERSAAVRYSCKVVENCEVDMKLSARNALAGTIRKIELGAVNAEVTLELAPDLTIVSIITIDAVEGLKLKVGERAYAVIKASSVMIGVD
jgi:molybdopterin-binding protein